MYGLHYANYMHFFLQNIWSCQKKVLTLHQVIKISITNLYLRFMKILGFNSDSKTIIVELTEREIYDLLDASNFRVLGYSELGCSFAVRRFRKLWSFFNDIEHKYFR